MTNATYPMKLKAGPLGASLTYIEDARKNGYRNDRFRWVSIIILEWDGKSLPVLVTAESGDEDKTSEGSRKWGAILNRAAAEALKANFLSAFNENKLTTLLPESIDSGAELIDETVNEGTFNRINEEYETDQLARKQFRESVDELRERIQYGVSDRTQVLYSYIERWLEAGYLGTLFGWYEEKTARIRGHMDDMARRKNRNHKGYIAAQEDIGRQLYSFSPPEAWKERPMVIS